MKTEKHILKNVDFDIIRYANCWEDADLLLEGLNLTEGSKVLSIGSGGDNSFSLLTTNPSLVVAVDVSNVQLYLIELKKAAISILEQEDYLKFIGFKKDEGKNRMLTYQAIKEKISVEANNYWDNQANSIKAGIVHQGKFEKYFQLFANKVLPMIHSKKTIAKLLEEKTPIDQELFFNNSWNTWRWRTFFKAFFSRFVMGRLGRDKSFLNEVEGSVSTFILNQAKAHLSSTNAQNNFMLNYTLTGDFKGQLPHYAKKENYDVVKQNLSKLKIVRGFAKDAIDQYGPFDGFNLSNIFEYLDQSTFKTLQTDLLKGSNPNARFAYWNLMVDRIMSNQNQELINQTKDHEVKDKGFFYKRFVVDTKK